VIGAGTCCGPNPNAQNFCDLVVADGVIYYEPSKKITPEPEWRPRKFEATIPNSLRERILAPPPALFESKTPSGRNCPKPNVHRGYYASGDSVLGAIKFVNKVCAKAKEKYNIDPSAIEMEGAGIAMACQPTGTKFTLVKGIMDFAHKKKDNWQESAAIISFGSVRQWAESLTDDDITALHVRDLPTFEPDPYKRANRLARLAGSMLPPRGVVLERPLPTPGPPVTKPPVTNYELRVEQFLQAGLCSDHKSGFVGEAIEDYSAKKRDINVNQGNWWIVDAVDGSENMIAARPEVALSIGYYENSEAKVALIHLPYRGLTVATTTANKLLVNGVAWAKRRAPARRLADAVLALPGDIQRLHGTGLETVMRDLVSKCKAVRITGALAYDLASIALGEIDARVSTSAELVDLAAGVPLVLARGGKVTNLQGEELMPLRTNPCELLAAATSELHTEILNEITKTRAGAAT
jgi:fructose-1,6-bisphosphatase/inositol monophosphatase family enzyme/nucleoside phosphorylase